MSLRDHQTLMREECARQADAMSTAVLFNNAGVLARRREAAQLTPQSVPSLPQSDRGAIRDDPCQSRGQAHYYRGGTKVSG